MKRSENRCENWRQEISLLAAGLLPEVEKTEVENHLASCQPCQAYHREMTLLSGSLKEWENNLSAVEATPALQQRWMRAVKTSAATTTATLPRLLWLELIWPHRLAWAGMAALWIVLLAVNSELAEHPKMEASAAPTHDWIMTWQEQNQVLAELNSPAFAAPSAPVLLPRPRSDRKRDWEII